MNGLTLVLATLAVASVRSQEFGRPVGPVPIPARSPEQLTRVTGASSDCALIVAGPPRSSQFGAAVDAFGGVGNVDLAGSTCITYDSVNAAFAQAKGQVGLPPVRGAFTTQDVANLGTVIQETSRFLARQFGLSKDAIANGLPQIDAARTDIQPFCPPFLMTPKCDVTRYRSISGFCNNLENPHWGASMHGYSRFLAPDFADGISAPRVSVTGQELPSPRLVWTQAHSTETKHDHAISTYLVAWGQFIDHEFTFAAEVRESDGRSPKCCDGSKNPQCLPIIIPNEDSFYGKFGQRCMNFVRNQPGLRHNCRLGPRNGFNHVSSFLDGGGTYSNEEARLRTLREFRGGRLNMLPMFDRFQMKRLLPVQLDRPDDGCIRPSEDVFCFESGDQRVNEQTILAMTHTLFAREHNRIADELAAINPHWNDETIFQETKHIVTALEQQITYNEFLPMVLGRDLMQQHNLILLKDGYLEGYDPKMNPSVATVVAVAAFRFGHSLLPNGIERWSTSHQFIGNQELHSMLNQPYDLYKEGWADEYLMGMANQVAQAMDLAVTSEVANHLFQEPGKPFGRDLATINIQRGREQGIAGYNAWRAWCGLSTFPTFDHMVGHVDNETINGYKQVYASPDDVDLWSAGISEVPMPGAMIGPTFGCIIGKQFHNFRFGDRFWYENGGWPSSFTVEQLNEIRKVKFSRIICDNGDAIQSMQIWAFVLPDHDINPRVPCGSGVLKRMDLTKWRDASFHPNP